MGVWDKEGHLYTYTETRKAIHMPQKPGLIRASLAITEHLSIYLFFSFLFHIRKFGGDSVNQGDSICLSILYEILLHAWTFVMWLQPR